MHRIKQKVRERAHLLSLLELDISLLLVSDIGAPGSEVFGLEPGLTPLFSLVLRPLGLDWNYTTCFPGPSACKKQIMGLLSLHLM